MSEEIINHLFNDFKCLSEGMNDTPKSHPPQVSLENCSIHYCSIWWGEFPKNEREPIGINQRIELGSSKTRRETFQNRTPMSTYQSITCFPSIIPGGFMDLVMSPHTLFVPYYVQNPRLAQSICAVNDVAHHTNQPSEERPWPLSFGSELDLNQVSQCVGVS